MKYLPIMLTPAQLDLIREAIDSHIYWQLSDIYYRNNGQVLGRGSDDPDAAADIRRYRRLDRRLQHLDESPS